MKTIRDAHFQKDWIDMTPQIPEPCIDWIAEKYLDVSYGPASLQKMDIYLPAQHGESCPLVVLVHGGGFCACDKRDWHLYPGFYALQAGFALASVNYQLSPEVRFPTPLDDLKTALRFLREHAVQYSISTRDVFLYGTSAGGNLVTLAAFQNAGTAQGVCGVAALCPLLDFEAQWHYLRTMTPAIPEREILCNAMIDYLGASPEQDRQTALRASTAMYITEAAPPFYIQHGTLDPAVPVAQAYQFAQQLREKCGEGNVHLDILEGVAHAGGGPEFLEEEHIAPILAFFRALCHKSEEEAAT